MNAPEFDAMRALAELYARNLPDDCGPHYYWVQTASFPIEFDITQDNANHIHSVWRDFASDWGGDLLKAHYQDSHRNEKA